MLVGDELRASYKTLRRKKSAALRCVAIASIDSDALTSYWPCPQNMLKRWGNTPPPCVTSPIVEDVQDCVCMLRLRPFIYVKVKIN